MSVASARWQVAAALLCVTALSCQKQPDKHGWVSDLDTLRSEMDGSVRYRADLMLEGLAGPVDGPRQELAMLVFRCEDERVWGHVVIDVPLATAISGARVRIDSLPMQAIPATVGAGNGRSSYVFFKDPWALLELRGHTSLLVEYPMDGYGSKGLAAFEVTGVEPHLPTLRAGCNSGIKGH